MWRKVVSYFLLQVRGDSTATLHVHIQQTQSALDSSNLETAPEERRCVYIGSCYMPRPTESTCHGRVHRVLTAVLWS